MNNLEVRSAPMIVEGHSVRSVVPVGDLVVNGRAWRLHAGALSRSAIERGRKLRLFVGNTAVGRSVSLDDRDDGLHVVFDLDSTDAGTEALTAARSGNARMLALLRPIRNTRDGEIDVVHEAALMRFDLDAGASEGVSAPLVIPRGVAERRLALLDL